MVNIAVVAAVVFVAMILEAAYSRHNERALRARGAIEPLDDVHHIMQWAYPGSFVLMMAESLLRDTGPFLWTTVGAVIFGAAKLLKLSAIRSLGECWSFRVLVVPGMPLVTSGPYRYVRHPNYLAVIGELVGAAAMFGAPVAGILATLGFGTLIRRRINVEERALGLRQVGNSQ